MLSYDGAEYMVHHCLEGSWGICKAKEHDRGFVQSIACFKGGFVFVSFLNAYVVISPSDVQLGIDVCPSQVGDEVGDEWKRILVADRDVVDPSIVLYGA